MCLIIITSSHRDHIEHVRKERINASELRYTLVTEAANDGLWDWDFTNNSVYYSPRWKAMVGYEIYEISDFPR